MKSSLRILASICLLFLVFPSACEKPQQRAAEQPEEPAAPELASPANVATPSAGAETPGPETAVAETADQPDPTNSPDPEPELSVAMEGDKILVSGALRSKIQVERIVETLERDFPDHQVESQLVIDYDRMGVGWGNRVADEFLVPFLQRVGDAKVVYRNSVVTLEGNLKSSGDLQIISETAINVFSGSTTESLVNKLKVSAFAKP